MPGIGGVRTHRRNMVIRLSPKVQDGSGKINNVMSNYLIWLPAVGISSESEIRYAFGLGRASQIACSLSVRNSKL